MDGCFADFNTKGFTSSLKNRQLPDQSHFSYGGCFNQLKFSIGPRAHKPLELYLGYARAQNQHSLFDSQINNYLTIFTKGNKDGQERDDRILNSVIILDVSGSMSSGLTRNGQGCRLQLAKEAILMFFSKLRPTDSFGLVVFGNTSKCIIPVQKVSQISFDIVKNVIKEIHAGGGTTLISGFNKAHQQLNRYLLNNFTPEQVKLPETQNRFIMLTDVCDNEVARAHTFIKQVQNSGIHTTIIGISDDFKSEYCQKLIEVKGFNYFCATQIDDLTKYLFQNFAYTFFPANYDIQINVEGENIRKIEVFGTVDYLKVEQYNKMAENNFIVSKTKSSFPSQLELTQQGEVKTFGGLILVKLQLKNPLLTTFDGVVKLNYCSGRGQKIQQNYPFHYESPANEQFFSQQALYEALCAFFYAYEVKNILKTVSLTNQRNNNAYAEPLKKMKQMIPGSKHEQLEDLIMTLSEKPITNQYEKDPMLEYM